MFSLLVHSLRMWCRAFWSGAHLGYHFLAKWSRYVMFVGDRLLSLALSRGRVVIFRMIQSIGWSPLSATQWRTSHGDILDLLSLPPAPNLSYFIPALCRNMSNDYSVVWEIARLVLEPPKRLRARLELSSEAHSTHPVLRLPLSQRRWFQALLEGKTWTRARLAQIGASSGACPMCPADRQDEAHRMWH